MQKEMDLDLEGGLSRLFRHPSFMRLQAQEERFRAFEVLGIASKERSHCDFLAFLLRPAAAHGLHHTFLWDFVSLVGDQPPNGKAYSPSLSMKSRLGVDLSRALLYRERHNIDVLIDCLPDGPVIGIEAKIWAGERDRQLADYQNVLSRNYRDGRQKLLVFLTLDGSDPRTADDQTDVPVVTLSWSQVVSLLDDRAGAQPSEEVAPFVTAFRRNIEDLTMDNPEDRALLQALFKDPQMAEIFRRIEKGRPALKDIQQELVFACERTILEVTGSRTLRMENRDSGEDFVIWLQVEDWATRLPVRLAFYHHPGWSANKQPGFNIVLAEDDIPTNGIAPEQVLRIMQSIPGACNDLQPLQGWHKKYQVLETPPDGQEVGWIIADESFDEEWIETATRLLKDQLQLLHSGLE